MPNLKISHNLHIGSLEFNRLKSYLLDERIKPLVKLILATTGVRMASTTDTSLQVSAGFGAGKVSIKKGVALDSDLNMIVLDSDLVDELTIPQDGIEYKVFIKYKKKSIEQGTVDLGVDGRLVGTGTNFLSHLRGMPNNPVKIRFPQSVLNQQDYEVLSVLSDTSALLNNNFYTPESNVPYSVVGCFSPGQIIAENQKNIYEFDSYELGVRFSVIQDPDAVDLAVVINNSGNLYLTDLRPINKITLI